MSRVTYLSLLPDATPELYSIMAEGETPHLTLFVFGDGSDRLADSIRDKLELWPGALRPIVADVIGQPVLAGQARVLLMEPQPFAALYRTLDGWFEALGLTRPTSLWGFNPHITRGKKLPAVDDPPETLRFSRLCVHGKTVKHIINLPRPGQVNFHDDNNVRQLRDDPPT